MKFNYKDVGKEIGWNFSTMKHTTEQDSPYYYYHKVVEYIQPDTVMLDLGCGSGEKSTKYFGLAKKIIMVDNEPEMLKKAKENVEKFYNENKASKFEFQIGDADGRLDYADETFDLVVSRHCGGNMHEIYRVLKKGGVFISEDIDDIDCLELKEYYNRGQNYPLDKTQKEKIFQDIFDAGFSEIKLLNFDQREYYPNIEELIFLLDHTPIIDGYDEENDRETLEKYCKDFITEKGVLLKRRLYAFELKK